MNRKLKTIVRDSLRLLLGRYLYTWLRFAITHRYIPNFKQPCSMNEKIIHRKFYDSPKKYSKYATKYTVRDYVKDVIGEKYLVPLLKISRNITPDDFKGLPKSFVIKTSNGGGGLNVLVVEDKSALNLDEVCNRFNSYLKIEAGKGTDELFYGLEEPLILFEELLKPNFGELRDFKWHVFGASSNSPKFFLQIDTNKQLVKSNYKRSIFDENGDRLPYQWGRYRPVEDFTVPKEFELMKELALQLASPFKYVRVDLFLVDNRVYFSELTFCNDSGFGAFSDKKYDFELGALWGEY